MQVWASPLQEASMSAKASFPIAVLLTVAALWNARGQDGATAIAGGVESADPQEALPVAPPLTSPMSSWIIHNQTDCCGPTGGSGPINTELFVRTGPSLPVAGGFLHKVLDTGWDIEGGGRSMFFNPAVDAAW